MSDSIKKVPIAPPITPPMECTAAQPNTPPQFAKAGPGIKNVPIRKPAKAAETIEMVIIIGMVKLDFLKEVPYPMSLVAKSKKMLAAVNPMK